MRIIVLCAALFILLTACAETDRGDAPLSVSAGTPLVQTERAEPLPTETVLAVSPTPTPVEMPVPTVEPVVVITAESEPAATPNDVVAQASPEPVATVAPVASVIPDDVRDPYPANFKTTPGEQPLSKEKQNWYYTGNKDHQPPTAQRIYDIRLYDACYLGDITQKVVYLTFDEGYENGFSGRILDVLAEKGVQAAFFMTQTFIRDNPALAERIAAEGHVAANHSVKHKSFPTLTDEEMAYELNETARYYEETTGYVMSPFFRPPSGEYSEYSLAMTQQLGYKTVFWSFAHVDWDRNDQPGKTVAFSRVMDSLHNGGIILLHAVSESNTEALPDIIDAIRAQGYTFASLYDLPDEP